MTRFIIAYTLGVLAVQAAPWLPPWWIGTLVLAVAMLLRWRFQLLSIALAVGLALTLWRAEWRLADRWPLARQGEEVLVIGHIASLPELSVEAADEETHHSKRDTGSNTWRFVFEPEDAKLPARIRASLYRSNLVLKGGECWRLRLRLKTPHGSANPGGFDYEGWLFRQGIGAQATVQAAEPCSSSASGYYPVLRARQRVQDALRHWLPDSTARPVLAALVMGDTSEISDADWEAFRRTGTTHLVAISGFNLAIVAGLVFWLWRWAWSCSARLTLRLPAQKAAAIAAAVAAIFYALLAGFEPPVTRALLMLLVGLAALFANRQTRPFQVLALAWGLIVLLDPFAVLAAGTWLSFGAVAAIFFISAGRLKAPPGWQVALKVQLGLSLLLAPLALYFFHGTAWLAAFVNLLAVPVFALLTPLVLVAVLLAVALPALGLPLLNACAAAVGITLEALRAVAESQGSGWLAIAPAPAALCMALLGVVLLLAPRGLPLKVLGLLCLLPLLKPPAAAPENGFTLTTLDVGQGLAVVVQTAQHTLLFDAGPAHGGGFDSGTSVVLPFLLSKGVKQLDVMMISHTDLDHRGGAPAVRKGIPVIEERGALAGTPCASGQHWIWDGVDFTVLNGPVDSAEEGEPNPDNNGGCVLRVAAGDHAALLTADIEKDAEARLLQTTSELMESEVLIAPHHGSKTSSTDDFVEAVNPDLVIFPAGFANSFRHPRGQVVDRYLAIGSVMHMTGHEGAISVHVDPVSGAGPATAWRQHWPHYWWAPPLPVPEDNR